ncbi:MAG TPA: gluconate 2-dehydrogenase subunit 3 family protein [Bryobacteraceae bacterium]|nr:gluconate 2-dehydrogenase subunit 3 family protein [Bryobacteraceae bacterium]
MRSGNLRRRKFLQLGASAAVAGPTLSCSGVKSRWRFLTLTEATTLEAVCDRIIPPDEDPGAGQAGAVNFIDRQLMGFYKPLRASYRTGLAGIDQASRGLFGARFVELPGDRQIAVLQAMEQDRAPGEAWKELPAKTFFNLLLAHTMQSFYGDPRHGGNREAASWRMLGIPNPPIRGRLHYDFAHPTQPGASQKG